MQIINRFPEEKKTKRTMDSMWKLFWSRQRPWVRGVTQKTAESTKVRTSNRVCVCFPTVDYTHSPSFSLTCAVSL